MEASSQYPTLDLHAFGYPITHPDAVIGISGSWDCWQTQTHLPHGKGSPCIPLMEGFTYSYKYIVDGKWAVDPRMPIVLDSEGNENNMITIPNLRILEKALTFKEIEKMPKRKVTKRARQTIRKIFRINKARKFTSEVEDPFPFGDTCKICLCRFPKHRMYRTESAQSYTCTHSMCFDCFEQYILRQIETLTLPIVCPECGEDTDPRDVKEIPFEVRRAYHMMLGYVQQKEYAQRCPDQCAIQYIAPLDSDGHTTCPSCHTRTCPTCLSSHEGDCASHKDALFQEYLKTLHSYAHCECGRHLNREGGCIYVRCKCGRDVRVYQRPTYFPIGAESSMDIDDQSQSNDGLDSLAGSSQPPDFSRAI